jgi:hypothetical protein
MMSNDARGGEPDSRQESSVGANETQAPLIGSDAGEDQQEGAPEVSDGDVEIDARILFLEKIADALGAEANRIAGPERAWLVRMWNAPHAMRLHSQAGVLLNEALCLLGRPPMQPDKRILGVIRFITIMQMVSLVGYGSVAVWLIDQGSWISAGVIIAILATMAFWCAPRRTVLVQRLR